MNLIGSRPNRWWENRPRAMRELVEELDSYAERTGESVTVVFDHRPKESPPASGGRVKVRFGDGKAQAADRLIAEMIGEHPDPDTVTVVTSDKPLARTVEAAGADVVGAGTFRDRLES